MVARHGLVLVLALAGNAAADKFTHTSDVKVNVKLTDKSKPIPKKDSTEPPAPSANKVLEVAGLLGPILDEQIGLLTDLIKQTPNTEVNDKADLYFRLGEIYAKQHRFHRLKSVEMEMAKGNAKVIADHKTKAHDALVNAIRIYKAFTDDPLYVNAPKIDTALFYFAYTLQNAGYVKEAREAYDKLLKNYPKSRFVPEAHYAFGEYHFEARQLNDAEARYRQVLKFPTSSVYHHAQYKLGWVDYNLGKFAEAMQQFNDVVQSTKSDKDKVLHNAAQKDFVRAYAEIGKADKALPSFKRVSGGDGIDMLAMLADLYLDQGKSDKAIYVFRELMTERPTSPNVCLWEHSVARAMMTAGTGEDRIREIEQLVKLYASLRDKKVLPKAEMIECRDAASEMSGQLARAYHQEGAKTKNHELLGYANRLYRAYLAAFPDAPDYGETQYFSAELAWLYAEMEQDRRLAVEKWRGAAQAFEAVVEKGKLSPKLVQVSADAAMLAWMKTLHVDPRVHQEPVGDTAYDKVAVPKPIPETEQKLLAAYDLYLKYVNDPKDGERIDVSFHKANLLRRYDHFSEAIPILQQIVTKNPEHEAAEWAAQLILDAYNRLQQYDNMFAFADKLPKAFVDAHPTLATTIGNIRKQGIGKQADALSKQADATKELPTYVACGDKYLQAYNLDPLADDAEKYLYNAGVCYENGRSLSAAMDVYKKLQELFPKSKLTAKSVARLGNVLASVAYYKEAAEHFEEYATKYGGEKDAFPLLSTAVNFRKGIGDDAKAIADTKKFVDMFGKQQPAEAANAFFSMAAIYEKQNDYDKLAAHLRAYLDKYGNIGGADRRVIASAKLGQALWQSSCPVPTIDGACMKMTRVASITRSSKLRIAGTVPKRCGDETQAELQIVPRDDRKVKLAMAAFTQTIADFEKLKPSTGDVRGALYHYALAKFGKAEHAYEDYLAMPLPNGLDFDTRKPGIAAQSHKRFETWLEGKVAKGGALKAQYDSVIALKDGAFAIAAAARLGALSQNFSVQLFRAEIPANLRVGPYAEDTSQEYCDTLLKYAEPLQKTAENSYEGCLQTSTKLGWFSEWSRACERELGQLMPDRYPKAFELRRTPDAYSAIVDLAGPERL